MLACTALSVPLFAAGFASGKLPHDRPVLPPLTRTVTVEQRYQGVKASTWASRYRRMRTLAYARLVRTRQLKRVLVAQPSVIEAIGLAAAAYGQSASFMRAIALCESTLQADPPHNNVNRGLFQFNPGTFAGTPYARFSIFSPYANALAAGWMLQQGRRGEWTC